MRKLTILLILLPAAPVFAVKLIPNGATSRSISVVFRDSDNEPNTSITVTDLDLYCQKDGAGAESTKIDCTALASADAPWTSGGAYHKGGGIFRVDIPDANLSDGAEALLTYRVDNAATPSEYDVAFYEVQLTRADFFTGPDYSTLVDNIVAAMDVNGLLVNWTAARAAILSEIHLSAIGDKVQADMDANSTKLAYLLEDVDLSSLVDLIQAAMDANSTKLAYLLEDIDLSTLVDNIQAAMDANSMIPDMNDYLSARADAIVADTAELQTDWTDGGRLDLILDAIRTYVSLGSVGRYASAYGLPSLAFVPSVILVLYYRRRKRNEQTFR